MGHTVCRIKIIILIIAP